MKDRPILFNGEMVRAILDGRKTQTRRVIKPQPSKARLGIGTPEHEWPDKYPELCPYGKPGSRLWLRETVCIAPKDWGPRDDSCISDNEHNLRHVEYKANGNNEEAMRDYGLKWRPSIHMPRWASRITLEIVDIRIEWVQEISRGDAIAEGVQYTTNPVADFADLWESINAKRGYGWNSNPQVWVVQFKMIKT